MVERKRGQAQSSCLPRVSSACLAFAKPMKTKAPSVACGVCLRAGLAAAERIEDELHRVEACQVPAVAAERPLDEVEGGVDRGWGWVLLVALEHLLQVNARSVVALSVEAHAVALEQQWRRLRQHAHVETGTISPVAVWPGAMDSQLTHLPLHQPKQPCGVPRNSGGAAAFALPHNTSLRMLGVALVATQQLRATQPHATHEAAAGDLVVYGELAVTECLVQHVHLLRVERRVARHGRVDASPRARSLPPV
eukprot:scaffold652_cov68-Phaeocystis_antarctica.AAC.3